MSTPEERLLAIGMAPATVANTLKNKKVTARFMEILDIGNVKEAPKETGALLNTLATKVKDQIAPYIKQCVERVVSAKWVKNQQIDAAVAYLEGKVHSIGEEYKIDEGEFDKATGVGINITTEQVEAAVNEYCAANEEQIKKLGHGYNWPVAIKALKDKLVWADGATMQKCVTAKKIEMCGPVPESDGKRKKVGKQTKEEKAVNQEKQKATVENTSEAQEEGVVGKYNIEDFQGRPVPFFSNTEELLAKHREFSKGRIITRFPPEPNGYLHIGHAKAIRFVFSVAKQYNGDCYLRFDDTNPCKENNEFIDHIKDIVNWLGYTPWKTTASSDYFDELYQFAVQLIKQDQAYVCFQKPEEVKNGREHGINSPWREKGIEWNLEMFEKMRTGRFQEGECALRMKIDMQHVNPNMKDPHAYRIRYTSHPHSGDKWCIYPTYDYTHCIVDSLENVTHSLCTLEFEIRRESYFWLLGALNLYRPNVWEYSRLNVSNTVTSKRKVEELVDAGLVRGWDDPRLHTIQGLRRRGYTPSMINSFCEAIGVSRKGNENITSYKKLEFYARRELDANAPRTFGITDALTLEIVNFDSIPESERSVEAVLFPSKPEAGSQKYRVEKEVYIERCDFSETEQKGFFGLMPGQPVILRYGPTVKMVEIVKNKAGGIDRIRVEKIPFEKKTKVVHWISKAHALPVEIRLYDSLLTHEDVKIASKESGKNWLEYMNPEALIIKDKNAFVWNLHKDAKVLDRFQFERVGYFAVDSDSTANKLVFNRIVELKESPAKNVDTKPVPAAKPAQKKAEPKPQAAATIAPASGATYSPDAKPEDVAALEALKAKLIQMKKDKAPKADIDVAVVELKRLKTVCGEVPPPKKK